MARRFQYNYFLFEAQFWSPATNVGYFPSYDWGGQFVIQKILVRATLEYSLSSVIHSENTVFHENSGYLLLPILFLEITTHPWWRDWEIVPT